MAFSDNSRHRITVCITCREKGREDRPGAHLLAALQADLPEGFDVCAVKCMAGCSRPCTVAYQAPGKATYLFGDIVLEEDLADLKTFAAQYRALEDGWCSSVDRPGKLRRTTLARIPAQIAQVIQSVDVCEEEPA
ncbi:hypothetical protein GCM10011316_23320 [Roseibium aquae]|uniref:Metal-binding protein n=1 Tax=Roseibium aquae TaxID=1323746 RepID=A0A916TL06_9HYPH|nr:DUF1636 domain-containing protein [Roseibium aquae]GGB50530.1 hypothetical protein GCM10011316_23320 [Roseibium aquae]